MIENTTKHNKAKGILLQGIHKSIVFFNKMSNYLNVFIMMYHTCILFVSGKNHNNVHIIE